MPQFFVAPEDIRDNTFELAGPEAFHAVKVLRLREGQQLKLFDGQGGRYEAEILHILPSGRLRGRITTRLHEPHPGPRAELRLYQGMLKSSRWELLLEKGTELGISCFVPLETIRTVVLIREARKASKVERWKKIVLAASKQSGGSRLPTVEAPLSFREAVQACEGKGLTLLGWEGLAGSQASEVLRNALAHFRTRVHRSPLSEGEGRVRVNLFIGPEGGFEEEEVELAQAHGAVLFGMGSRTLRSETAALAASGLVLYELGAI